MNIQPKPTGTELLFMRSRSAPQGGTVQDLPRSTPQAEVPRAPERPRASPPTTPPNSPATPPRSRPVEGGPRAEPPRLPGGQQAGPEPVPEGPQGGPEPAPPRSAEGSTLGTPVKSDPEAQPTDAQAAARLRRLSQLLTASKPADPDAPKAADPLVPSVQGPTESVFLQLDGESEQSELEAAPSDPASPPANHNLSIVGSMPATDVASAQVLASPKSEASRAQVLGPARDQKPSPASTTPEVSDSPFGSQVSIPQADASIAARSKPQQAALKDESALPAPEPGEKTSPSQAGAPRTVDSLRATAHASGELQPSDSSSQANASTQAIGQSVSPLRSPPAAAALATAPGHPSFATELGRQVMIWLREGVQQAELQLNPIELGPVQVQLQLEGQQAQVRLLAEQPATRETLQQALGELGRSLAEQGLQLGQADVSDPRSRAREGSGGDTPRARSVSSTSVTPSGQDPSLATLRSAGVRPRGLLDLYA